MVSIILLLILAFGFFMGLKRGFVLQLMHSIGFIVSFIIATTSYRALAEHLSLWIPYPDLSDDTMLAVFLNTMPLEHAFYNAVSFAIIFFAVKVILQIIASMLDFVARLPILRTVNKMLGSVLGFLEVYLILFILLYISALVPVLAVQEWLDSSLVAKLIIEQTPILSSLMESLWFS